MFAQAIFDAFADDMWQRLEGQQPFLSDISRLFEVVAEQFGRTLAFVVDRGDRAGARKMLESYKGPVGSWYQAMKTDLADG